MQRSRLPKQFGIALALAVGAAAIVASMLLRPRSQTAGEFPGQFQLLSTRGQMVTNQTLLGRPYAIFFGFTRCPDICPATLAKLARARREIGAKADNLSLLFVGVDTTEDTPQSVSRYLAAFDPSFIGLSGTAQQIASAAAAFGVKYQRVEAKAPGEITIEHTGLVYLVGRDGRLAGTIGRQESSAIARVRIDRLLRQ
jgi:protein SCO1/2